MARFSQSSSGSLRMRLSSFAGYLEAVTELRTRLLHSSPSCLISNPEELISLVEVAKSTLQNNGITLHTFSSCPDYLSAYKTAYFGLLLQLQAHSHNARLESKDLQVRLNRLLFPLSTQLRVSTRGTGKAVRGGYATQTCGVKQPGNKYSCGPTESKPVLSSPVTLPDSLYRPERPTSLPRLPNLPSNVMLPPRAPLRHNVPSSKSSNMSAFIPSESIASEPRRGTCGSLDDMRSDLSGRRKVSYDTVQAKRHRGESVVPHSPHKTPTAHGTGYSMSRDEDDSSGSNSDGDDSDSDTEHIVVPSHSPLRRSFGIFCTGKGRGAFSGSGLVQRRRIRPRMRNDTCSLRRESNEVAMDTDT